jgi:hypothetical protein
MSRHFKRGVESVLVRVANFQSVSAGPLKSRGIFVESLTKWGEWGTPDVVLGCEAADFRAEMLAENNGYEAAQFTESSATAGSVVAWSAKHRALSEPRLIPGTPAGEGIQARSLVQVKLAIRGHRTYYAAGHTPPDRAANGQDTYLDRIRKVRGVVGLDSNNWPGEIEARGYLRNYYGVALLGAFVPKRIPTSLPRAIDIGSDHKAVDLLLWPTVNNEENR